MPLSSSSPSSPDCTAVRRVASARAGGASASGDLKAQQEQIVLVVDDDSSLRMLAVAMLEIGGFKTFVACNGLEALQQLTKHPEVSAVLLDLLMPVMNGADALREMRKLWPAVRVILVSGFEESETTHRFGEQAPNAFLQKPFTLEMLTGAVRSSLN